MLTVILLFLILEGIMYLIDIPFKNKIKNSTSVETSLKARKTLKWVRIITTFVLIVVLCVIDIAIGISFGSTDEIGQVIGRDVGLIIAYAIMKGWSLLKGNIQTYSKEGYLSRHNNFVLYLRAFEADFYNKSPKSHSLESNLTKAIKKMGSNICAIGMTKELDAPYGADRVYVGDDTWQTDVAELMQKAKMIFILMSDRESCIWEIAQGARMLDKICFIVNDAEKYKNIKNNSTHHIHFPEYDTIAGKLGDSQSNKVVCFVMYDGKMELFEFDSEDSPSKIYNQLIEVDQIRKLM